jgi:hypothetical protein
MARAPPARELAEELSEELRGQQTGSVNCQVYDAWHEPLDHS